MAGAKFGVEVDDSQVKAAFDRLLEAGSDLEPAFRDIGEYLLISHRDRFRAQESPEGAPWTPLSPRYRARKKRNRDKILVFEGWLSGRLTYAAGPDRLVFGTPMIYGATHQFGDPKRNIPARPFLGISQDDRGEIFDILQDHIEVAWSG